MKVPPREDIRVDLCMTPMIDVVFQLLIFFMVGTKMRALEGRIDAFLPKFEGQSGGKSEDEFGRLVIHIAHGGGLTLNGIVCENYQALLDRLKSAKLKHANPRVILDPVQTAKHEHVMRTMDTCLKAGLHEVSFRQPLAPTK